MLLILGKFVATTTYGRIRPKHVNWKLMFQSFFLFQPFSKIMKCHYDVLGLARDATRDEIKKSYRKLALQWHPDKNPDNLEECHKQFNLIQQAYETLYDPQERAWYDRHRQAILKGGLADYQDDSLDVSQYFTTSCFSGYGNDEPGFYGVYRKVFEKIAEEDEPFLESQKHRTELPSFGVAESSYDDVVHVFYAHWQSYCTAKTYVWLEKYDIRDAPNRRVMRLMEKDNKKLRDAAKKERNEAVRALVTFVRKRDKRVQSYRKILEERALQQKKNVEEQKMRARQERLEGMRNYEEAEWASVSAMEASLQEIEQELNREFGSSSSESDKEDVEQRDDDTEEEDEYSSLFCVACNKAFQSDKAFINHERSKKHRENVARVKAEMEAEDEQFCKEEEADSSSADSESIPQEDCDDNGDIEKLEEIKQMHTPNMKERNANSPSLDENIENDFLSDDFQQPPDLQTEEGKPKPKLSKKQKKRRRQQKQTENVHSFLNSEKEQNNDENDVNAEKAETDERIHVGVRVNEPELVPGVSAETKKVVKGKKNPAVRQHTVSEGEDKELWCHVCKNVFSSRNKLFSHIKETGHAQVKGVRSQREQKKKKGKR